MFVSSFSFNQLALTYFYLNVELMINDFLDRTKLISIVILSTETTVFKFDLFYEFFFKKIQLEKKMAAVSTFSLLILHYFTSDYLHMLEECVNLKLVPDTFRVAIYWRGLATIELKHQWHLSELEASLS